MRPAVFTFYSYKGGVGRTVLAANMALALARRGKTLIWDLDVEAPGLHRITALQGTGEIKAGFFDWLLAWQSDKLRQPDQASLEQFAQLLRQTPFANLTLLPAHGEQQNSLALYYRIMSALQRNC
jgi:cellulose biosynthesis protein BcsQ